MKVIVSDKISSSDALFIFVPEKKWDKKIFGKFLPTVLEKQIANSFSQKDLKGELGEIIQLFPSISGQKKTFLIGTGKGEYLREQRRAGGAAIRKAKKLKIAKVQFLLPNNLDVRRIISGAILGNYEFKIGDKKEHFSPTSLQIICQDKITAKEVNAEKDLAEATNFARDLINLPANLLTPKVLSNKAKEVGKGVGNKVKVKIYGEKELKKLKMDSFFGVGQGSHEESQLIVLEYNGGKKNEKPLVLIGKGVCFDAGGYNLKPTNHIEEMKSDMSGAASVLGAFQWIAKQNPKKNIMGVIGAVENLVSGQAFKPGDVLNSMGGKTIEITNTDAEGRLVLADCLYYAAKKYKPALMIDLATLTGAAIAALGYEITALLGNDKKMMSKVIKAAEEADEDVWELPITPHFKEKTKGEISDLLNWTAGVSAGSSMAAAFLDHFVDNTPWVHMDIAGTAFHSKYGDEITQKGATGVMVRTLKNIIAE
ncbi:leucyl aminopeptidase [Candidatus Gracilibacteria bacterium]|nr:leucyl aminopeptidase [Candidatus Gracilibacteria bacterium]